MAGIIRGSVGGACINNFTLLFLKEPLFVLFPPPIIFHSYIWIFISLDFFFLLFLLQKKNTTKKSKQKTSKPSLFDFPLSLPSTLSFNSFSPSELNA